MLPQKHPATPRAPSFSSSSSSSPPPLPNDLHSSSIQRSTAQPHSQQDLQQLHLSPLSHSQQLHLLPSSSSAAASFSSSSSSSSPPQHPLDDQQLHDYHQQLRFQQQRLLLQQQQQQALIQLQNLQIRQKKKLQEEHQRHFQQQSYLQHQEPHQQRQQQQVQEEHPQLSFSSPSSSPTTQAPSISTKDFATHQHLQQSSLVQAQPYQPSLFAPLLGSSSQEGGPSGLISAPAPAVSMDILAMAPFPLHQPHSFASGPVAIQQPMQHLSAQDQPFKQLYQVSGTPGNPFHPLKYETGQSLESQPTNPVTADTSGSGGINGCQSNGWIRSEGALLTESLFRSDTQDPLRRLSNSSAGTDLSSRSPGLVHEVCFRTMIPNDFVLWSQIIVVWRFGALRKGDKAAVAKASFRHHSCVFTPIGMFPFSLFAFY
ncbi:MAG: hypothetical protein J3Q66DRAFT_22643 [Benniella sp.]|nr:MAG: hypothetical protein J3Q66DRAFT_22643 [Benniella sp.]